MFLLRIVSILFHPFIKVLRDIILFYLTMQNMGIQNTSREECKQYGIIFWQNDA